MTTPHFPEIHGVPTVSANHPGNAATQRFIDAAIKYDGDPADWQELADASDAYEKAWGLPPLMSLTIEEFDAMLKADQ